MKRILAMTVALGFWVAASPALADCKCSLAKSKNGWCKDCGVGYVASIKIKSDKLFKALEGMTPAGDSIKCPECKMAHESDGFCKSCNVGFVGKKKYRSSFAYHLAKGEPKDPAHLYCEGCKKNAASRGWCKSCKVGMIGSQAYKGKELFELASKARDIVTYASKAASKCLGCAIAMITDGKCAACDASFKGGQRVASRTP